jgi:PDZ domain-containing secreted protein
VMVSVDDQPVQTLDDLLRYIERKRTGDHIMFKVIRDGVPVSIPLGVRQAAGEATGLTAGAAVAAQGIAKEPSARNQEQ